MQESLEAEGAHLKPCFGGQGREVARRQGALLREEERLVFRGAQSVRVVGVSAAVPDVNGCSGRCRCVAWW